VQWIFHHGFGRVIGGRIAFSGQALGAALGVVIRFVAQVQFFVFARALGVAQLGVQKL
jgi:hypothetical protein